MIYSYYTSRNLEECLRLRHDLLWEQMGRPGQVGLNIPVTVGLLRWVRTGHSGSIGDEEIRRLGLWYRVFTAWIALGFLAAYVALEVARHLANRGKDSSEQIPHEQSTGDVTNRPASEFKKNVAKT